MHIKLGKLVAFSLSPLNLAEIGHSTQKRNRPLFLVDAAWEVYAA